MSDYIQMMQMLFFRIDFYADFMIMGREIWRLLIYIVQTKNLLNEMLSVLNVLVIKLLKINAEHTGSGKIATSINQARRLESCIRLCKDAKVMRSQNIWQRTLQRNYWNCERNHSR